MKKSHISELRFFIITFCCVLFLQAQFSVAFCQTYTLKIKEIRINNLLVPTSNYSKIVLSEQDTISFEYDLDKQSAQPFLFNLNLIKDSDTATRTAGYKEVTYSSLTDGEYTLQLSAFDLQGAWATSITSIVFRVDNSEAALLGQIKQLEIAKQSADSTMAELNKEITSKQDSDLFLRYGAIAALALALIFIVLFIITQVKNRTLKKVASNLEGTVQEVHKLQKQQQHDEAEQIEKLKYKVDAINKYMENISELRDSIDNRVAQVQDKTSDLSGLRKQKNDVFSDVLKGISNPTNAIKSLVELLRNYDFNAKDMQGIVENIVDATSKIIENADAIQRLSELSGNEMQLNLELSDIKQVINSAIKKNSTEANNKNIEIQVNIDKSVKNVQFDAQKMLVVVHNLLHNAVKFTNKKGKININAYIRDDKLFVEVADTGVGIEQADLKKMYANLSSAAENYDIVDTAGTLGLYTVKKYVEAHDGRVAVSSVINQGSKFTFNIPAS